MAVATLVVAAGQGSRFGGPKQFEALGNRSLVEHAVEAARAVSSQVIVALPPEVDRVVEGATTVVGGRTRSESVRRAFAALEGAPEFVLVHDAARPLAPVSLFERVIARLANGAAVVVPALPVADTIKEVRDGRVTRTLERAHLRAIQTPQGFHYGVLAGVIGSGLEGTDDAVVAEQLGWTVEVVDGSPSARKVTTRRDLRDLIGVRVGLGLDQHPRSDEPGRPLVLGGVTVPGPGLRAHSDGDALCHAVADAMLGAAGIGGIGDLYADTDPAFRGADSLELLAGCVRLVRGRGLRVVQVDATIVCETPKLSPYLARMARTIEGVVAAPALVKAKHPEGIGALGRGEGVAALAVVLLEGVVDAED
ncbi:2-C-methyl-D-erythritol 4-phosphate cytidylyltransferase [Acidimicrobium ferrooxidans DSM 10331]|uniref:2-C-methyl-D-erythritol 2,4-cyclodiphosphate synthase n=1 Tax=Acidimicrobium ferrooxidans (strain DSM 10331 / JCM 15462 / NBRC 103882 / ICP) TaxID=525909 RepID=C7M1Q8_ACIFD|nr:2-C-methyl-D-erythritol 2,4-cyclodiphosphate synthase [Acidimicrobium ferrooxidans]ACU54805.1 2-C-methyl-D-erythritol 4-phosphate cytidylyltransferase [Acidimicrobium ferrooxidans DSM 10331]